MFVVRFVLICNNRGSILRLVLEIVSSWSRVYHDYETKGDSLPRETVIGLLLRLANKKIHCERGKGTKLFDNGDFVNGNSCWNSWREIIRFLAQSFSISES